MWCDVMSCHVMYVLIFVRPHHLEDLPQASPHHGFALDLLRLGELEWERVRFGDPERVPGGNVVPQLVSEIGLYLQ